MFVGSYMPHLYSLSCAIIHRVFEVFVPDKCISVGLLGNVWTPRLFDSDLTFQPHVYKRVQAFFSIHAPTVRPWRNYPYFFIFSKLDYRTTLSFRAYQQKNHSHASDLSSHLVLTGITLHRFLASLHWLHVRFRIHFKISLITFKARLSLALNCIASMPT